jgi:hypothetical protein
MPAGEWTIAKSVAAPNAGREARSLTASAAANVWNFASARTRCARRVVMSPAQFIALVAGWGASLVLLLLVSAFARYFS